MKMIILVVIILIIVIGGALFISKQQTAACKKHDGEMIFSHYQPVLIFNPTTRTTSTYMQPTYKCSVEY